MPGRWSVKLEFKPQDLWIGLYWKRTNCEIEHGSEPFVTDVWICLVPCLPIHVTYWHRSAIPFLSGNTQSGEEEEQAPC